MIVIVDYGMGNLGSIRNMLRKIGAPAKVSADVAEIRTAGKLILPGVGAFDTAMRRLNESGLREVLDDWALVQRKPVLGLCLGMQLLTRGSEEGDLAGLGWIGGETRRFRFEGEQSRLKIPHMGWNSITRRDKPLVSTLEEHSRFYFVHSYHVVLDSDEDVAAVTRYGYEFPSIVQRGNIMGTQFHPEKSHRFGMRLLRSFAELETC